jgi:hypothetical protein
MIRIPNAVGLLLCQQTVVEDKTKNVTLVNTFTRMNASQFPTPPRKFIVFSSLVGGVGAVKLSLVVSRLDTLDEVFDRAWDVTFEDPLRIERLIVRPAAISFPVPGKYEVVLRANGEPIAQSALWLLDVED